MSSGGRDRLAVRHPGPAGLPQASLLPGRPPRAVVVGAGIAGLAAATGLAERGVQVTVLEREDYLGGRAGGWTEPSGLPMSRGFHAFFRQYYNLRALLRRADPGLRRLVPLTDYPLIDGNGHRDSFRGLPRTPPWNALAFALRSPTFRFRDLLTLDAAAAAPLAAVSVPGIYRALDDVDAETYLQAVNFPPAARHLAFEVFSRSFFAPPGEMSAAELAVMFHLYFLGSSEGLLFDVPDAGFDVALWHPLRAYLAARDADIRTGTTVTAVEPGGPRRFLVHTAGGPLAADAVVLATDVRGLRSLVRQSPGLADPAWRETVAAQRTAPPFLVWRLWLDRPADPSRPAFLGTGGLSPVDNISVLDRFDRQARCWHREHGGSVVELHAYAAAGDPGLPPSPALLGQALDRLHSLYPETASARVLAEAVQWHDDCPMFGVGGFGRRPRVRTPFPGLVLAGDGIRIDLPVALMERAASTGWHAANCLLARWGLAGHELYSVPTRGRLAPLRWLAARGSPPLTAARLTRLPRPDPPGGPPMTRLTRRWPERWPLQPMPRDHWARQQPTWAAARPSLIDAAVKRAEARPSGNWFVLAASRDVRPDRPFGSVVAGLEVVAWRDAEGRLVAGPGACPHLGAPLERAAVDCGALVCRWHGLRVGPGQGAGWRPLPAYDDGVLAWIRLDAVGGEEPLPAPVVPARPPRATSIAAVATMTGTCEPGDVMANRLDPWHGSWFHPYSFSRLTVLSAPPETGTAETGTAETGTAETTDEDDRFVVAVTFKVAPRLGVPVTAEFTCPEPRTVVMRIVEGEGAGSVVETHVTPRGRGPDGRPRTSVIEAVVAGSPRPGFAVARAAGPALRPVMRRAAARLWRDDLAYAERRYQLRSR